MLLELNQTIEFKQGMSFDESFERIKIAFLSEIIFG